jgi:hypothetical protein
MTGAGATAVLSAIDGIKMVVQGTEQNARDVLYPLIESYGIAIVMGSTHDNTESTHDITDSIPIQFQERIRPDGLPIWWHKFPGQGQRPTPVTSPKGLLEILALLPGRAPAAIRRAAFDTLAAIGVDAAEGGEKTDCTCGGGEGSGLTDSAFARRRSQLWLAAACARVRRDWTPFLSWVSARRTSHCCSRRSPEIWSR